jgi:NAD(P)-dependent dehydrogenase (short-subunit alcohol dehydrogenase family)
VKNVLLGVVAPLVPAVPPERYLIYHGGRQAWRPDRGGRPGWARHGAEEAGRSALVTFLASPQAIFINGAHVPVDGAQRKAIMDS